MGLLTSFLAVGFIYIFLISFLAVGFMLSNLMDIFFYRLFIILQLPNTFLMVVQIQGSCLKYLIMSRYVSFSLFSLLYIWMSVLC